MAPGVESMSSALPRDWRARLCKRLSALPDHRLEHSRIGIRPAALPDVDATALTAAAVLVPIILRAESPALLLTVRASHLRSHAGQISFPGGRAEPQDRDLTAAALRETQEEIGIAAALIEPIGFLSDQIVRSGYRITPLVALVQPDFTLATDATEVAGVFELPLAFALSAGNYRSRPGRVRGLDFEIWELPFGEHNIWGATAGILANLRELLSEADA